MIVSTSDVDAAAFTAATGWAIEPEGACRGDVCVPLGGGPFDLDGAAERLGVAVVRDGDLTALGPDAVSGRALTTARAPEIELADLDGREFRLSSLRGSKVVLVAWAPY